MTGHIQHNQPPQRSPITGWDIKPVTNKVRSAAKWIDVICCGAAGSVSAIFSGAAGAADSFVAILNRDGERTAREVTAGTVETVLRPIPLIEQLIFIGIVLNTKTGRKLQDKIAEYEPIDSFLRSLADTELGRRLLVENGKIRIGDTDVVKFARRTIEELFDYAENGPLKLPPQTPAIELHQGHEGIFEVPRAIESPTTHEPK